jgi:hypothetical protein
MVTAKLFIDRMQTIETKFQGSIPKIEIFKLAKESISMPISEVIKLLKNKNHDQRVGAVEKLAKPVRQKYLDAKGSKEPMKYVFAISLFLLISLNQSFAADSVEGFSEDTGTGIRIWYRLTGTVSQEVVTLIPGTDIPSILGKYTIGTATM